MQRIYLYEECTANPLDANKGLIQELADEGMAMILALAEDFGRISGVKTCLFINTAHLAKVNPPQGCELIPVQGEFKPDMFQKKLCETDKIVVVAPECESILHERIKQAQNADAKVLNASLHSVALTSNKLQTAEILKKAGVLTPPTFSLADEKGFLELPFPRVIKPIDGAGAANTFKIKDEKSWKHVSSYGCLQNKEAFLVQPWIEGQPASICFFSHAGITLPITSGFQIISGEETIQYQGGKMPLSEHLHDRANRLAGPALKNFPGLEYWVGVDLILGHNENGEEDYVLEINPRLTTSYLGARKGLPNNNLAKLWLNMEEKGIFWPIERTISFDKKGSSLIL
ncbi:MAG: ATP-grasp domain-containing protein [Planctomycetia bacterium]